jgi:Na+-driven multidrug efflux pump
VSGLLLIALGLLQVVHAGGAAVAMYMNGANVVRFQVILGLITAVVAIALKLYLLPIIGISGVVWATIFAYTLCVGVPSYVFLRRRWRIEHAL